MKQAQHRTHGLSEANLSLAASTNTSLRGLTYAVALATLTAALTGCGGSGPLVPPAHVTVSFSAPTPVSMPANSVVYGISPNGHMVGSAFGGSSLLYWDTPTSTPVMLNQGGLTGFVTYGVNDAGIVVGSATQNGHHVPVAWANSTSAPTVLALPAGETDGIAFSINASGQIAGDTNANANIRGLVWDTMADAPTVLAGPSGGSPLGQDVARISDDGHIYGFNGSANLMWSSATANSQALAVPPGTDYSFATNLGYALNPGTGEVGGAAHLGSAYNAFMWNQPGFGVTNLPSAAGFGGNTSLVAVGKTHLYLGYAIGSTNTPVAWTSKTTPFVDLNTLIPANSGWVLDSVMHMTDNGYVIGTGVSGGSVGYYVMHLNP